jgi:DNA-binding NtrC family response regulator
VAAQNRLRNYPWPGNMSELKNLVHRLLLLGGDEEIRLDEIERELAAQLPKDEPLVKQDLLALPLREAREAFERAYLQQQLLAVQWQGRAISEESRHGADASLPKVALWGVDFRQGADD